MGYNLDKKLLSAGDLYYSPNFVDSQIFPSATAANLVVVKNLLEQNAFTSVGGIQDFETSIVIDGVKKITVDNCNVGDVAIYATKGAKLKFKWVDNNDIPVVAALLGINTVSVPNTAVSSFPQPVKTGLWQKNVFIALSNQNGDLTAITPASVSNSIGGALTAGATGYTVTTDALGRSGIVINTGYTGSLAGDITITYGYTPYQHTITGFQAGIDDLPLGGECSVKCVKLGFANLTIKWI